MSENSNYRHSVPGSRVRSPYLLGAGGKPSTCVSTGGTRTAGKLRRSRSKQSTVRTIATFQNNTCPETVVCVIESTQIMNTRGSTKYIVKINQPISVESKRFRRFQEHS